MADLRKSGRHGVIVQDSGTTVATDVGVLDFGTGNSVTVNADGSVTVDSTGGGGGGSGDVEGPASSTDNAIARFHLTTGKVIQNSSVTISDAGSITIPASQTVDGRDLSVDGAKLDGIEAGADVTDATNVLAALAAATAAIDLNGQNITDVGTVDGRDVSADGTALDAHIAAASPHSGHALTSTTISAGTGLTGGGDLSANRTLSVSYGTTAGTATQGNDARVPSQDENDALQGTSGTPSNTNRYATDADARLGFAAAMAYGFGFDDGPTFSGALTKDIWSVTSASTGGTVTPRASSVGVMIQFTGTLTINHNFDFSSLGGAGGAGGNGGAGGAAVANVGSPCPAGSTTQVFTYTQIAGSTVSGGSAGTSGSGVGGVGGTGSVGRQFEGGLGGGGGGGGGGVSGAASAGRNPGSSGNSTLSQLPTRAVTAPMTVDVAALTTTTIGRLSGAGSGGGGGGSGGEAGGTAGGNGGPGGTGGSGLIHLRGHTIAGTATVAANGGNGSVGANGTASTGTAGAGGGGGGGGGGAAGVVIIRADVLGGGITASASGGTGGTGGTAGTAGGTGGSGAAGGNGGAGGAGFLSSVAL